MKVTLISPYEVITAYGMRMLSAVLKAEGIKTQMVQLPRESAGIRWIWGGFRFTFPEAVLDQVAEVARDSDLIGITLMSNYFENAVQITQHLRRSCNVPIIWGGVHPTIRPEECLEYADLVCIGEGEEALRELVLQMGRGEGCANIRNIWHKHNSEIVRSPLRPLPSDLDSYPYPDYDLNDEFVLHKGRLQPMTRDILTYCLRQGSVTSRSVTYRVFMTRGCRHYCTYCVNNAYHKIYGDEWRVRRRSVPNVIGELRQILSRFPEIEYISIGDDFFLSDVETIREFSSAYKQEIGIPFSIAGFYPGMVDEEKIGLLVDAGLHRAWVGVQTGSMRILNQVYRRPYTPKQLAKTFEVLHKFTDRTEAPTYQLIMDNPWETEEDQMETLRMLLRLPKPYHLDLFSLTLFPGTALYERAKREGLVMDDHRQIYQKNFFKLKHTYINSLFRLFRSQSTPNWVIAILMSAPLRQLYWIKLPERIGRLSQICVRLKKGMGRLQRGDWSPVRNLLKKIFSG